MIEEETTTPLLNSSWTPLRGHDEQERLLYSPARFKVVPAGRRSGKTEIAKRYTILRALSPWDTRLPRPARSERPRYFFGAPVWQQAKRIYWHHLLELIPDWAYYPNKKRGTSISEMTIKLISGAEIYVVGMDKPERIEGSPWDGGVLDEYASMKAETWQMHVRPALSDRQGWCWFIGVPEGRNHYFDLYQMATAAAVDAKNRQAVPEWESFHWKSIDILPLEEVESARRDLDPLTFSQEYEASFISFHGQAYYQFDRTTHCRELQYDPTQDLIVCFDFNVSPGVAVICQEQPMPGQTEKIIDNGLVREVPIIGTGVIGEVYIPRNSNTPAVCRRILKDWGRHKGKVFVYGDATGGAGGSAQVEGSDWDIVKRVFREHYEWNSKLFYMIPQSNPKERARINAVNSRMKNSVGISRLMVDPLKAPYVVKDLEGVRLLEGGSGEIDKRHDPNLTHSSDALGYYIVNKFPVSPSESYSIEVLW